MTQHLSPQEFVDAADGTLAAARLSHIDACDPCRAQLVTLRGLISDVDLAAAVPEPSPLFWEHFSQRVRTATAAESPVATRAWWLGWRPLSLGALLAVAVMVIALQVRETPRPTSLGQSVRIDVAAPVTPPAAAEIALSSDDSWDLMVMMASDLSTDDLHHLAAPMTGVADTMATDLTVAEQKELVRLIRREMGNE